MGPTSTPATCRPSQVSGPLPKSGFGIEDLGYLVFIFIYGREFSFRVSGSTVRMHCLGLRFGFEGLGLGLNPLRYADLANWLLDQVDSHPSLMFPRMELAWLEGSCALEGTAEAFLLLRVSPNTTFCFARSLVK